jgi:signal transduction histidine kinase
MTTRRNVELLAELFESCPVAIGVRDVVDGRALVHVEDNRRAAALFGKTPEELRGLSEESLGVPAAQVARAIHRLREARATGRPARVELTVDSKLGPRTLAGNVIALEHGPEERYAFVLDDVTELRALQASVARAEQLAMIGTLSASIGHEIANPAMYAQLHLQFAIDRAVHDGAADVLVDDLRTALAGMTQVTTLLRDLRSLTMDTMPASEITDVEPTLHAVLDLVRPSLSTASVHVDAPQTAPVTIARGRLMQVLLNLVRNAVESVGPQGGNVWVAVAQPSPARVRIDVADDGPGLEPELRARLFEPFATTKANGTGLGLYVSRMLVTRAGGTIEAQDRPGGGLRMRVELPAAG